MTLKITEEELDELCQENNCVEYLRPNYISRYDVPKQLGRGSDRILELRPGLELAIGKCTWNDTVIIENIHDPFAYLAAKFYLSGGQRTVTPNVPGVTDDYEEVAERNYLFFLPDLREFEHMPADRITSDVRIYWEPMLLRSYLSEFDRLPLLQKCIEGRALQRFHQSLGNTTPEMKRILHQILHCPFQEGVKRMYLESKALELLALQLAQWTEEPSSKKRSLQLSPQDLERLHQAKHLLTTNLNNPPSLTDLACQVGLNSDKLKRGFRQVFGTTVFGYLYERRIHLASQLLQAQSMTIAGVAAAVGYASATAFNAAFQRRYGMSPKRYQQIYRGTNRDR